MQIKFVGTGGAFEPHKGNASAIVEHDGTTVLIDCGYATLERLIEKNLVKYLDYVLITHLHADHVGSLPTLLVYIETLIGKELPIIYATDAHKEDLAAFLTMTWEEKRMHFIPMSDFSWMGYVDTYGLHVPERQTFSYYFTDGDELIFYAGDIGSTETTLDFLATRSEKNIRIFQDINKKEGGSAHVSYKEAAEKLKNYNVYGYHCDKATMPSDNTVKLVEDYPDLNY